MKKREIGIVIVLILMATGIPLFAAGQAEPVKRIELKYGTGQPPTHPSCIAIQKFADTVNEKSNGKIFIEVYDSAQLGALDVMIKAVQMGTLDMTTTKPSHLMDVGIDKVKVLGLPFLWKDLQHAFKVLDGEIGQELLDEVQKANVHMIGLGYQQESGRNMFTNRKPITRLADVKGMKLRVQPVEMHTDMALALGASPTPTAWSETYSALQNRMVDGAENPLSGYYSTRLHEVAPFLTITEHEMAPSIIVFSEITWHKLSKEQQTLLKETWAEVERDFFRPMSAQKDIEIKEKLVAEGATIYQLTDRDAWIAAMKSVYDQYAVGVEDYLARIQQAAE